MHEALLRKAIALALESVHKNAGGPFGAVVARDGLILGEGTNQVTAANDPTAHAEMVAIRQACRALSTFSLAGCVIYTSCEPCPMCLAAIYWARLDRVYYAGSRSDAGAAGFDDAILYREICLPFEQRRLPMVQLQQNEAQAAFDAWQTAPHKIRY